MKARTRLLRSRIRLGVEQLEDRWCPALAASLSNGLLTISGAADNAAINVVQDSATAGTINVSDGTTAVSGSPFTGVNSIRLDLTSADDNVTLDLGGQALPGNVTANLGGGADTLTVQNGSISGALAVTPDAYASGSRGACAHGGGSDTDASTAGTGADAVARGFLRRGGRGFTAAKRGRRSADAAPADTGPDTVTLAAGTTVNSLYVRGGQAGTTVNVSGEVDGSLVFTGSDLDDTLNVSGTIGQNVAASLFGGADKVTIGGAVTGGLALNTGAGDDQITLSNVVGGRSFVSAGAGSDTLMIAAPASFASPVVVRMGAGADTVTLDDAATISTLIVNGGTGTDTFAGTPTRTGLTLISF